MALDPFENVPVRVGEVLAEKYVVERVLGIGGMGAVVAARHMQLGQLVALKFILPTALRDTHAVERFLREARTVVRLQSEHVARVLDVGTLANGAPFLVMEYLEGRDLGRVLDEQGPLSVHDAAAFVIDACDALAEAHGSGVVHRDIKPANLFLTKRASGHHVVKVLDFGISKIASESAATASRLTATTAVMGSPVYMAPEQMRSSKAADPRADIWALGVVLYELVSGKLPFDADSVPELCLKVVTDPPPPLRVVRPDVPEAFAQIVVRCLEKDPARRYGSAAELAGALAQFAPSSRQTAEHARRVHDELGPLLNQANARTTPSGAFAPTGLSTPADGSLARGSATPGSILAADHAGASTLSEHGALSARVAGATPRPRRIVVLAAAGALAVAIALGLAWSRGASTSLHGAPGHAAGEMATARTTDGALGRDRSLPAASATIGIAPMAASASAAAPIAASGSFASTASAASSPSIAASAASVTSSSGLSPRGGPHSRPVASAKAQGERAPVQAAPAADDEIPSLR